MIIYTTLSTIHSLFSAKLRLSLLSEETRIKVYKFAAHGSRMSCVPRGEFSKTKGRGLGNDTVGLFCANHVWQGGRQRGRKSLSLQSSGRQSGINARYTPRDNSFLWAPAKHVSLKKVQATDASSTLQWSSAPRLMARVGRSRAMNTARRENL